MAEKRITIRKASISVGLLRYILTFVAIVSPTNSQEANPTSNLINGGNSGINLPIQGGQKNKIDIHINQHIVPPDNKVKEAPLTVERFYLSSNELSRFISPYIEEKMIETGIQQSLRLEKQSDTVQVNLVSKIEEKNHIYDEYITRLTTQLEIRDKNGIIFKRNFTKPGTSHKNYELALRSASSMIVDEIESQAILYNAIDKIKSQYSSR